MGGDGQPVDRNGFDSRGGTTGGATARANDDRAHVDVAGWLSRAAGGDQQAWANLVDRFAPAVWAATRAEASDPAISAEAAQTTWLRLADRLTHDLDLSRFETWLVETARREVQRCSLLRGLSATSA